MAARGACGLAWETASAYQYRRIALLQVLHSLTYNGVRHLPEHGLLNSGSDAWRVDVQGVTFEVKSGEAVGIVGRTGSGKSSLIVALFRLAEPHQGAIMLDGHNLLDLGLQVPSRGSWSGPVPHRCGHPVVMCAGAAQSPLDMGDLQNADMIQLRPRKFYNHCSQAWLASVLTHVLAGCARPHCSHSSGAHPVLRHHPQQCGPLQPA